jgi:hypothetical protein
MTDTTLIVGSRLASATSDDGVTPSRELDPQQTHPHDDEETVIARESTVTDRLPMRVSSSWAQVVRPIAGRPPERTIAASMRREQPGLHDTTGRTP